MRRRVRPTDYPYDLPYIVASCCIVYFLYHYLFIFTITTQNECLRLAEFWLSEGWSLSSPAGMFAAYIGLSFVLVVLDGIAGFVHDRRIGSGQLACHVSVLIFLMGWAWSLYKLDEYFLVDNGAIPVEDYLAPQWLPSYRYIQQQGVVKICQYLTYEQDPYRLP